MSLPLCIKRISLDWDWVFLFVCKNNVYPDFLDSEHAPSMRHASYTQIGLLVLDATNHERYQLPSSETTHSLTWHLKHYVPVTKVGAFSKAAVRLYVLCS